MIRPGMIFKKIAKAATAHLALPEWSPLNQSSHHQVQIRNFKNWLECENELRSIPSHLATWSSGCSVPLKCILLMVKSYWKFDCSSLDQSSDLQEFDTQLLFSSICFWTARATLARANVSRVGFFWLVLVGWLMMSHFFEPSVFRWAVKQQKGLVYAWFW